MSGYLQRLASSARPPSGGIHPVVGALHESARLQPGPKTFLPVEQEVVVKSAAEPYRALDPPPRWEAMPPGQRPATEPVAEARAIPWAPEPAQPVSAERPRPDRIEPRPFTPLAPPTLQGEPLVVKTTVEAPVREVVERVERRMEDIRREPVPGRPYRPLEDARPVSTQIRTVVRESAAPGAVPTRSRRSDAQARSVQPESKPDEIQIHIGRIEVTAVGPQPVRPAAAPPRKGLRLDEYLNRQDRRVR